MHVIHHAGKILALEEGHWPFEVDSQLETVGPYSVNLWYVGLEHGVYVVAASGGESRWARRISKDPAVRLRIENQLFELQATTLDETYPAFAEVQKAFRDKYDVDAEEDFPDIILYRLDKRG